MCFGLGLGRTKNGFCFMLLQVPALAMAARQKEKEEARALLKKKELEDKKREHLRKVSESEVMVSVVQKVMKRHALLFFSLRRCSSNSSIWSKRCKWSYYHYNKKWRKKRW